MTALLGIGVLSLASSIVGLASPSTQGIPLWFFYLALAPSLLSLLGAYLLWRRSVWAIAPLPFAAGLRAAPYLFMVPYNGPPLSSTFAGQLFERLPPRVSIEAGVLLAIALYCVFLRKWSAIS